VYTSGTTGTPKGILHTHFARERMASSLALAFGVRESSKTLLTTPLFTNGTWAVMLPTVLLGGTVVLMRRFDPKAFLNLVEREKCTHTLMVPTQFNMVLQDPDLRRRDLSSLEALVSVGSALRLETRTAILAAFPCEFYELYGLTEGVGTVIGRRHMALKPGSVGKPGTGNDIRIIDPAGRELPGGEIGEIVGYASGLMKGYYKRPDLTEEILWRDERGRTYIKTGDVGRLDEDGFLYLLDRKKDMIVSGGINVFASDVEEVFSRHPEVADVAVIGAPHETWGETPVALVIPKPGASIAEDELREWGNARLGKYQRVSEVRLWDHFPRNALGKVLKRGLREAYFSHPMS